MAKYFLYATIADEKFADWLNAKMQKGETYEEGLKRLLKYREGKE